jgi:hypothetical protein
LYCYISVFWGYISQYQEYLEMCENELYIAYAIVLEREVFECILYFSMRNSGRYFLEDSVDDFQVFLDGLKIFESVIEL